MDNMDKNITIIKDCKYRLPCGWCDRKNEICQFEAQAEAITIDIPEEVATAEYELSNKLCIEHKWECSGADTAGWSYTCRKCGATKRESFHDSPTPITTTSGYINTNKCPEVTVESILTTNTTTSAQTIAKEND